MKPNKHLDEQIKAALENLKADYDPGSWDMLEERLDAPTPNDSHSLDSFLANRLSGLEAPLYQDSWSLMQQRIEAEEVADLIEKEATIDNFTYEKLHRFEVPYQSHHWSLMARRLEEEYSLRNKLYRYKVAELALMFLLLLTVVRFFPLADAYFQKQDKAQPTEQFQQKAPHQTDNREEIQAQPKAGRESTKNSISSVPAGAGAIHPSYGTDQLPPPAEGPESLAASGPGIMMTSTGSSLPNLPTPSVQALPSADNQPNLGKAAANGDESPISTPTLFSESVASGFISVSDLQLVQTNTGPALILPDILPFHKMRELRFSIFAAVDYSYVFTPSDQYNVFGTSVSTDSDTTAASGYGAGILVNFKRGKWELQTGGIYSFKRYVPNTPVFLFETVKYYVEENFHGIQQDILQVPLNVQYYFKDRGNWRMYTTTGASMNFITSSVYEILYRRTPTFNLGIASAPGDETKSIRKEKEFPRGLLEGGSFNDNFYLTANIGLGVERYVSPNWSIYFQPNYHHYLMSDGIGTNKDKFYTLSLYLGTKISLK